MEPEEDYEDEYLERAARPMWRIVAAILIFGLLGFYAGSYLVSLWN